MVSLEKIQAYMRQQAEEDKKKKHVQVTGENLEDALKQASIELNLPLKKLDYEILEAGSRGVAGFGKKQCILVAYEAAKKEEAAAIEDLDDVDLGFESEPVENADMDGGVFVKLDSEGIFLKVSPPKGSGNKVTERMAIDKIGSRTISDIDEAMVAKVVKVADGEFIRIGDYEYNPANDAVMTIDITDSDMKGYLLASPPTLGGTDPSYESIISFLENSGIVHGIDEDAVRGFVDDPTYNRAVLVARGTEPVNGGDARIIYNFEKDRSKVNLKEKDGKVDFKELNLVQNVVEGQVLAKKIEAEEGQPGTTVMGKILPAKDGVNIDFSIGKNVRVSDDGLSAIADKNGQVIITTGKINVEPVYVVAGDVNLRTGNILFLGTVMINGSVEDGFSVKAAGNIEVKGTVGKCEMDAEGDIIVHQGITGKSAGIVKCGHSVWSKFIENTKVEAGEMVVVSDGIINSEVYANKRIICKGKRASIVGGHLRAAEEINAKTLGSVAGMETILEVGYDPKNKEKLTTLNEKKEELQKGLEDIELNMSTLENLKKTKKELPEEKQKYYVDLKRKKAEIVGEITSTNKEIDKIQTYLTQLKIKGKVSASGTVYPGVKVYIKEAVLDVRNEFKAVTFISEAGTVKVTKYEESEEDISRKG
jgi:uncharacterized protein